MRIVAVADTHTFEEDLRELPDGDVFIHAGDLVRGGTLDELAPVAAWIRQLPHRNKIVVSGKLRRIDADVPATFDAIGLHPFSPDVYLLRPCPAPAPAPP